jgi:peptidyl-prolyl cis-trans isomerase D
VKLITKKHLARAEREHKQVQIILIIAFSLAAVIIGLVSYGLIQGYLIGPNQKVAEVNGKSILVKDFQADAALRRVDDLLLYNQIQQYISIYQSIGLSVDTQLQLQVLNIQYEMSNKTFLGNAVITKMIEDVLIEDEAAKAGITVSDAEVSQKIQEFMGYFANGTPTPTITTTPYITPTYSLTQESILATVTPTPIVSTPTATSTTAPTIEPTATDPSIALTLTAMPTATLEPTSTPYTFDAFQANVSNYQASLKRFGATSSQFEKYIYHKLLRQKMLAYISASIAPIADQVWLRDIVVGSQDEANKVVSRISAGENWDIVANEVSTDTNTKGNGGDLGWFPKGASVASAEVETAAFEMKVSEIRIVQVSDKWHVIQLAGKDSNRPIREDYLQILKNTAFSNWLENLKSTSKITTFDVWKNWVPVLPTLPPTTTAN